MRRPHRHRYEPVATRTVTHHHTLMTLVLAHCTVCGRYRTRARRGEWSVAQLTTRLSSTERL